MKVGELQALLAKFNPQMDFIVVPPPDQGDAEYQVMGIDEWNGTCAMSIQTPQDEIQTPEQIAQKIPDQGPSAQEIEELESMTDQEPLN